MTAIRSCTHLLPPLSVLFIVTASPPSKLGFLAWVALCPFLFSLETASFGRAAVHSALFGYLFAAGLFWWLPASGSAPWLHFLLILVPLTSLFYLLFGLSYWLLARVFPKPLPFIAPALWVTMEYARANASFLAMPWNLISQTQYRHLPLIQISNITGNYGVSYLIVMVNVVCTSLLIGFIYSRGISRPPCDRGSGLNSALISVFVMILVVTYGIYSMQRPEGSETVSVGVVQGNSVVARGMSREEKIEHLKVYEDLTLKLAETGPDLIVWPASTLPGSINSSRLVRVRIERLARLAATHLLVGGSGGDKMTTERDDSRRRYANSEFLVAPDGRIEAKYHKQKLVPFDEYLPYSDRVRWPRWLTGLKASATSGRTSKVFEIPSGRFGAPICWENLFPGIFRQFVRGGSDFMVSVTNDSFMGESRGPYQALAMNVFRAVENSISVVRASSTGISGLIIPNGKISATIQDGEGKEVNVAGTLVLQVPITSRRTFYTAYGDLFSYANIVVSIIFIFISICFEMNKNGKKLSGR